MTSTGWASASWPSSERPSAWRFPRLSLRGLRSLQGVRVWGNAPLAPFTTIGTGGKAGLLVTVADADGPWSAARRLLEDSGASLGLLWGPGPTSWWPIAVPGSVVTSSDESFQYVEGLPSRPGSQARAGNVCSTVGAAVFLAAPRGSGGRGRARRAGVRLRHPGHRSGAGWP